MSRELSSDYVSTPQVTECTHCYSGLTYPHRVREGLGQLTSIPPLAAGDNLCDNSKTVEYSWRAGLRVSKIRPRVLLDCKGRRCVPGAPHSEVHGGHRKARHVRLQSLSIRRYHHVQPLDLP